MDRRVGVAAVAGVMLVSGCTHGAGEGDKRTAVAQSAPAPTPTPTPTHTHRTLKADMRNADVKELQQRLKALHYDPGKLDGKYGETTVAAVWAFEKVNHLKRTATVGSRVWRALDAPRQPRVLVPKGPGDRVEIDLRHQLLTVYKNGQVALISHMSSGSGELFCSEGSCRYAGTSTGDFRTGRRASGWETGPLGSLYNPIYFNGGIAMHGALSVPLYPASHGCVRLPMHTADVLPKLVGTGERVYVRRPK